MKNVLILVLKVVIGVVVVLYGIPCIAAFIASLVGLMGLGVLAPTVIIPFIVIFGLSIWLVYRFLKWLFNKIDDSITSK